ncbi:transmembrane protein 237 [Lutzomyia longipalpis]|uniref:transmembrane protein 237 n=1 Tax=Lutzomyia longipalpis TaxID=7200 RepID=UPI002483B0A2|nr:transmembrane protein 237 [Lutzomyia longipalpis]
MEVPKVHHSKSKSRRSRHKNGSPAPTPENHQNGDTSRVEGGTLEENSMEDNTKGATEVSSRKHECVEGVEESTNRTSDHIQKGILGYIDRQIVSQQRKHQSLSDPQGSPAQRSIRSRSSMERSPRMKRSKSESRRRKERKLIAAGEMEVRQANETLMKYLKQCSDTNDASLSGDLEIDKNADMQRHTIRKSKSQRIAGPSFRSVPMLSSTCPSRYDITAVLDELGNDVIRQRNTSDIYNPFTPVVSPTDGPPTRIDKMFIQTTSGYRSVDTNFYKTSLDADPEANNWTSLNNSLYLACALQYFWHLLSNICHGLLGGLAMGHLIFVFSTTPHSWNKDFLAQYALFAEVFYNVFYFLAILCVVSVFDRMDLAQISLSNASKTISFRWMVVILPIYLVTVILSLSGDTFTDKVYFFNYNITMIEVNNPESKVISIWNTLSVARSVGAIVGWILVALSPIDLLYSRLAEMEKYLIN